MMSDRICFNCFREKTLDCSCPYCGYDPKMDKELYPEALLHGSLLAGQYITGRVLGQGGFGITYVALDKKLQIKVAAKEYLPDMMAGRSAGSPQVTAYTGERGGQYQYGLEQFLEEARVLAKFNGNPNIVSVRSFFEQNGTAYFVMDYITGTSFKTYLSNHGGRVSWEEAVRILTPVMDALSAVHKEGIIHRDVTPDNIYITSDGQVKLLDFGAARYSLGDRSRSLDVVLKPGYAPKEQYTRKGRQGPYTDVYSLAACFYAAITGVLPPESLDRMEEDDLVPPSARGIAIPRDLEDAILCGLEVRSEDRYQTMDEFRKAVVVTSNVLPETGAVEPEQTTDTETGLMDRISGEYPGNGIQFSEEVEVEAQDNANNRYDGWEAVDSDAVNQASTSTDSFDSSETTSNRKSKKIKIAAPVILGILAIAILIPTVIGPAINRAGNYQNAQSLLTAGEYDAAEAAFASLGDYRDSSDMALEAQYQKALALVAEGQYESAISIWLELGFYSDSIIKAQEAKDAWTEADYQAAIELMSGARYLDALKAFSALSGYKDSDNLYKTICYSYASELCQKGDYKTAINYFSDAGDYLDAENRKTDATYNYACQLLDNGDYSMAMTTFEECVGYQDTANKILDAKYGYATSHKDHDDRTTFDYLQELVEKKYPGAKSVYAELYDWKITVTAVNTGGDSTENMTSISRYKPVCFTYKLTGGVPGSSTEINLRINYPDGGTWSGEWEDNCSNGHIGGFSWPDGMISAGTLTARFYDSDNNLIGSGSVKIT